MNAFSLHDSSQRLMRAQMALVDALDGAQYQQAHVPVAVNLPPWAVASSAAVVLAVAGSDRRCTAPGLPAGPVGPPLELEELG